MSAYSESRARRARRRFLFPVAVVRKVTRQIDSGWIAVDEGQKANGQDELWLQALDPDGAPCGGEENSSHICPPDPVCP